MKRYHLIFCCSVLFEVEFFDNSSFHIVFVEDAESVVFEIPLSENKHTKICFGKRNVFFEYFDKYFVGFFVLINLTNEIYRGNKRRLSSRRTRWRVVSGDTADMIY